MDAKDQLKLLNAGFIIIRKDEVQLRIKAKRKEKPEWHTLEKGFDSKAALQKKMDEFLKLSTVVED